VTFAGEPGSFTVPPGTDVRALAGVLAPETPDRVAELRVRTDHALTLRRRASTTVENIAEGWDRIELPFGRTEMLADDLASFGPEVIVEAPDDLRVAVRTRLAATAGVPA
jgi:proteasome accessory factor B